MIKFLAAHDDDNLIGLGLSERNVELLKEGKPIKIDLDEMDPSGEARQSLRYIVIFYGKTEQDMAIDLESAISEDTLIHKFDDRHGEV